MASYRAAVTVLASVLDRRGFDTQVLANLGPFEVDAMINAQALRFVALKHKSDSSKCYVHFDTEPRALSEIQLRKLMESTYNGLWTPETDTLIVVSVDPPAPKAKEYAMNLDPGYLQLFWLQDLVSDRMKSEWMPPHRALEPSEVTKLGLDLGDMPKLVLSQDAAAQWYGIRPGQVVEITRSSQLTGESLYYRLCIR